MATLDALLGPIGAQYSNRSKFSAWRRAATETPGTVRLMPLAQAAGGEIALSSPLGQWMLAVSRRIDGDGAAVPISKLGPVRAQIGESPFMNWARLETVST